MTLSVDDAGIEVGYRHRWRPDRGEAVHLGVVAVREGRFVGTHPYPAHREAGIPIASGISDFSSSGSAPPPAPRKTNLPATERRLPPIVSFVSTRQRPSGRRSR